MKMHQDAAFPRRSETRKTGPARAQAHQPLVSNERVRGFERQRASRTFGNQTTDVGYPIPATPISASG